MSHILPLRSDDDKRKAEVELRLDARSMNSRERSILAQYARLGRDPVYAGDMLMSPDLVDQLAPHRRSHRQTNEDTDA